MVKHQYNKNSITIITASNNKYLALKNMENSESVIGRPTQIILSNTSDIPEFEERDM